MTPHSTSRGRPFAFSVAKVDTIYAIHPTLAPAIDSARNRFPTPSAMIAISAWFTADQARALEHSRFPAVGAA